MKLPPPPTSLRLLLSNAKVVWKNWNVQSMVLTSFIIQLVLIFLAPFRKHTSNTVIVASLWFAYLLADWVAIQSIGLISNPLTTTASDDDNELYAFWAQFLLLHLGGPDTITALALEDNELWLRTGLHLGVQIYGSLGILVKSVSRSQSGIWLPSLLIFTAGVIKYMERLSSMFHGRLLKFSKLGRPKIRSWGFEQRGHKSLYPDVDLVRNSLFLFLHHKRLYVGGPLSFRDAYMYMYPRTPEEAFGVLEIQFNLAYEAFYTKTALICTKWRWKALRLVVTLLQVGCLVIWLFSINKEGLKEYNIRITYTLLVGGVALDVIAFLRIHLLSDWAIALNFFYDSNWEKKQPAMLLFHHMILSTRKRTWGRYRRREDAPFWDSFRRVLFRRWSESIPQLSILSLCFDEQSNKVYRFLGGGKGIKQRQYISRKWFSNHLRDFLYEDVKEKVKTRGAVENIGKVKGGWACHILMSKYHTEMISIPIICELLDVHGEYYVILMRWHIITELCYQDDHLYHVNINATNVEEEECNYREICKIISNYLMYLIIHRQDMVSPPADGNKKLRNTYKDIKRILKNHLARKGVEEASSKRESSCYEILRHKLTQEKNVNPHRILHFPVEGILGELEELEKKQIGKWEFMAKVWNELLYYAAIQCKPNLHASNLKQGGELLSFVWLLLIHMEFGLDGSYKYTPAKDLLFVSDLERCCTPRDDEFHQNESIVLS